MTGYFFSIGADAVLVVHFAIAAYNVFSLPVIWLGKITGKRFVHNPWFRYSHIACMGIVLLLVLFQEICPFTDWEFGLRQLAATHGHSAPTLLQNFLGDILYYDASWTLFGIIYGLWFAAIITTLWLVPVKHSGTANHTRLED